ncbi:unnamed protein product [Schistosoma rodhaini]|nr:unnamed protein product [Schistosoma rodhaini]
MNKEDYITKMNVILSDSAKFKSDSQIDNVKLVEKQICRELHLLMLHGFITEAHYKTLKPIGTCTPEMYGLPKLHKPGTPMRPILSMINSPYHKLAKWLKGILDPVCEQLSTHTVIDSFGLLPTLEHLNISNSRMCSFDVNSLFTNVPLEETVEFICDFITSHNIRISIPTTYLRDLILLCTKNIKFYFQGKAYMQIDGVAMGSPLGPVLANIFMGMIERQVSQFIDGITLYKRYVDDILVILPQSTDINQVNDLFNAIHPNLKVTYEEENNNELAFLDILLHRRPDGSIRRRVHRKPTWSGQYLHFTSFCPIQYKRSIVKTLFARASRICTVDTLDDEFKFITETLKLNGYPETFIGHQNTNTTKLIATDVPKKPVYLQLPFKGDHCMKITTKQTAAAIKKTFNAANLRLITTTQSISVNPIKSPRPIQSKSHCIYQFTCNCGESYLGRTDRRLEDRIGEHIPRWLIKSMIHPPSPSSQDRSRNPASSIAKHLMMSGHQIDPKSAFRVVTCHQNPHTLKLLEAILIGRKSPTLCVQKQLYVDLCLPWF